jgi:hypothetical protein
MRRSPKYYARRRFAANCAIHLGMVHIEEWGPAEYWGHGSHGRSRWGNDDEEEENASNEDFEVVEVADGWWYIDHWLTAEDRAADFGRLPLGEGELLPAGALDGEPPDEQRVLEATGNEGASFERSYHRAVLVIWPRSRFVEVLLQAGARAALPYLEARATSCAEAHSGAERAAVLSEARRIVEAWERHISDDGRDGTDDYGFDLDGEVSKDDIGNDADPRRDAASDRTRMVTLLGGLADTQLLERFIGGAVTAQFTDSEAVALVAVARLLGARQCGELFSRLVLRRMCASPRGCVGLFARLTAEHRAPIPPDWMAALRTIAAAVVDTLPALAQRASSADRSAALKGKSADAETLADLLDALAALEAPTLRTAACAAVIANGKGFDPRAVVVPALRTMRARGTTVIRDAVGEPLWLHAADVLLARSEYPPAPPSDWRQDVKLACACVDCRQLQAFAGDPAEQTHRFRVRKDRRQHLHRQIDRHRLDMTHVTERTGSPQTLVCTKTRRTYQRRRMEYRQDIAALDVLAELVEDSRGDLASHCARIAAARERAAANVD